MNNLNKIIKAGTIAFTTLALSGQAMAVCPVCTIAAGVGFGVARWLGISDLIAATWIGALIASSSMWLVNLTTKKGITFKGLREIILISFYILVIFTLWALNMIGITGNTIWGADKIVAGIAIGTVVFLVTEIYYEFTRAKRGKALFPFQKVVMPFGTLAIISFIFYLLGI